MQIACPLSIIALVALVTAGCDRFDADGPQSTADDSVQVVAVQTALLESVQIVEPIFATGTLLAKKSTDLVPMVGGLIEEIFVAVGDRVEPGQPLLRMRKKDFQIKVERLIQATDLAEAEFQDAERDLANTIELKKKEVYSTEELNDRRTRVEVTEAKLGIAQANLAEAKKELDDSVLLAPYRGVITRRNVDEGAYVPSVMRSSNPVLQIQKIDIMVAQVFVAEAHLPAIKLGMPGRVRIPSLDRTYDAEVELINDRLNSKTRTIEIRLDIRNADYAIKPGLFTEVQLIPGPRTALMVPPDAVIGLGSERYLYVAEEGAAVQRKVHVRELEGGRLELISGVAPEGEIIVGSDRYLVQGGTPIQVRN